MKMQTINPNLCRAQESDVSTIQQIAQDCMVYVPSKAEMAQSDIAHLNQHIIAFTTWQAVCDEATLLALAVAAPYRRHGIARALLHYGEQRLSANKITQCFLEVRASNQAAQQLYRHCGYTAIATRADYYSCSTGREEAVVMRKYLSGLS